METIEMVVVAILVQLGVWLGQRVYYGWVVPRVLGPIWTRREANRILEEARVRREREGGSPGTGWG